MHDIYEYLNTLLEIICSSTKNKADILLLTCIKYELEERKSL